MTTEQCDGHCHDQGTGDCNRCSSDDSMQWCDECLTNVEPRS